MTKIYIIRHAEAEGNLYKRIHGHYDSLLTELGYRQVEALEDRFRAVQIDAVYSSDLIRTRETAKAIYLPKDLPLIVSSELREVNMGVWEDLYWGEVEDEYPEQLYYYNTSPEKWQIEGGENYFELQSRIVSAVLRIAAENSGRTIAIFTHGAAIRALLGYILNIQPSNISTIQYCDNTAVALLNIDEGKISLEYMNDDSHLSDDLSSFRKETWWKEEGCTDNRNMRFLPMDLNTEGKTYLNCYRDAWYEAHGTYRGFSNIYLQWAKSRSHVDPHSVARAYLKGVPCGIIELAGETDRGDNSGHIAFLYLSPEFRGRGLAVQLIGYAVWYYRKLGRTKLILHVSVENKRAQALYKKYGFCPTATEKGTVCEILVMEKDIRIL